MAFFILNANLINMDLLVLFLRISAKAAITLCPIASTPFKRKPRCFYAKVTKCGPKALLCILLQPALEKAYEYKLDIDFAINMFTTFINVVW